MGLVDFVIDDRQSEAHDRLRTPVFAVHLMPVERLAGLGYRRRMTRVVLSLALAAAYSGLPSQAAETLAHCPNVSAQINVYGDMNPAGSTNAVKAVIPWTNPNVCSQSVSHSIDINISSGWVQVGWWKTSGSSVRGYCEVQSPVTPGNYQFLDFAVTAASHTYNWTYDTGDQIWDCQLDTSVKLSRTSGYVGFTSGPSIGVQGEAKGQHVQIGKMAPGALLISGMQYRKATTGTWLAVNVTVHTPPSPYSIAEPAVGKMQLWTNAH